MRPFLAKMDEKKTTEWRLFEKIYDTNANFFFPNYFTEEESKRAFELQFFFAEILDKFVTKGSYKFNRVLYVSSMNTPESLEPTQIIFDLQKWLF